ncbi:ABC transporter permease [Lactococcus nasutitermitis]|uniref:ABC transporter permease n=1 Tax=Lactococcus nasutitermitis TaxID=1652957 RepID=A0ABV9JEC9_9LACT|nr:ABC transporter permease [Lactococcus nasutitermitis]
MRIFAIFRRILLQRREDKRSLALLFIAPLLILTLMYFLMQTPSNVKYRVGIDNRAENTELVNALKTSKKLTIFHVNNSQRHTINSKNLDAVIVIDKTRVDTTFSNQSIASSRVIDGLVTQAVQETQAKFASIATQNTLKKLTAQLVTTNPTLAQQIKTKLNNLQNPTSLSLHTHYLYGNSNPSTFNDLAPAFIGGFVFFFVFLISGISLVNERTSGTLERMLTTPVKRSEIVAGYTLAYGLLALLQTAVIVSFSHWVLAVQVNGNLIWVFIINFLLALIALLAGLLFSTLAKTEFQFVQFIPIVIVPQFLFSGIINVSTMSEPLQWIAHVIPVYYAIQALQVVIKRGEGFSNIVVNLLILLVISLLLYLLNILSLKRLRHT